MINVVNRDYWPKEWPDWPKDRKARKVVAGLFELGLDILNAPASLRKFRLEQADKKAQYFLSQMTDEEQEQARYLVALWEKNALIQQSIRYEEQKKGIDAVKHLWPKWDSAGMQMKKAEEEALQLGLMGHEYFGLRKERFYILQAEKDKYGEYHNLPDYSEAQEQWYSQKPMTARLPWPWDDMLIFCKRFEGREHKVKKWPEGLKLAIVIVKDILTLAVGIAGMVMPLIVDKF